MVPNDFLFSTSEIHWAYIYNKVGEQTKFMNQDDILM